MTDTKTDLAVIEGRLDSKGDEVRQHHPIENPGGDPETEDPILEPHPDEPGVTSKEYPSRRTG